MEWQCHCQDHAKKSNHEAPQTLGSAGLVDLGLLDFAVLVEAVEVESCRPKDCHPKKNLQHHCGLLDFAAPVAHQMPDFAAPMPHSNPKMVSAALVVHMQ